MSTSHLFLDIETNGIGRFRPPTQRAVQVSWIYEEKENDYLIRDVSALSTDPSYPCKHVSLEILRRDGVAFDTMWRALKRDLMSADVIVAHNALFDKGVLLYELKARGYDRRTIRWLRQKQTFCTMFRATNFCALPFDGTSGTTARYKWPRLAELYHRLFSKEPDHASLHNSLYDCRILRQCWKRGADLDVFE